MPRAHGPILKARPTTNTYTYIHACTWTNDNTQTLTHTRRCTQDFNGHALYAMSTVIWVQSKSLPMTAYMLNTANGAPGFGRWRLTLANDDSISIILDATKPVGIKFKEDTSPDSMPQRASKAEEPQPNPDAIPSHQVIKVDSVESDEQGHKNGDTRTHVHNICPLNQRVR